MTPPAKRPKRNPNPTWKEKDNLHTEQAQGKKNEPNQNKPKQNKEAKKGKDKVLPTTMPTPLQEVNVSAIASNVASAFVPKPLSPIILAESTPKEVKAVEYDDPQPQTEVPFIPEHASNPPEEANPNVSGTVAANITAAFVPKPASPIVVAESTPKHAEVAFIPEPTPHEEANVSAEVVSPPKEVRAAHSVADQPPAEDGISAFMPDTATPIPALRPTSSRAEYLNLPNTNPCCISIDENYGRFYACKYCGPVPVRQERPFTCGRWREHIKTADHVQKAKLADDAKKVIEKRQSEGKQLTRIEQFRYKQLKQKQVSLTNWTTKAKSPPPSTRNANNAHSPISNSLCSATNNSDSITTTNNSVAATRSASVSSVGTISINTSSLQIMSCEGIFKDFRTDKLKKAFSCYNLNCRANINSTYKFCFVGGYVTVFSKECNGKDGIQRQRTKGIKGKDAIYFSCRHCFELMSTSSRRIKATIMNRTDGITRVEEIIRKHDIAPSDFKSMKDFSNTNDTHLSPIDLHLKQTVKLHMQYYQNMEKSVVVKNRVTGSCGFIPGVDNFLKQFIKLYLSQDDTFKNSLLVCLMRSYVAKANGVNNPQYAAKVMNFFVAIAASGDKRSFEFVSGNLCAISLRHTQRVVATKRSMPFINLTTSVIVETMKTQFARIHAKSNSMNCRVAFSVGIDATVLVKAWQYCQRENAIVGGAFPNHFLDISNKSSDDVRVFLEECIKGKHGVLAAEIKVAVISFQNSPPGMCPYFVLIGHPQSINESNDFGEKVLSACEEAARQDGNAAVLNESTDGVSCEVAWNKKITLEYLDGKKNYISLPDTNHNVKNARYQLIGGSSPASIGYYTFDPWLLKQAGISKELIRVEDYASDAVVLRLASLKTIEKMVALDSEDVGNAFVVIVSLLFLRMRSYAVNARTATWKERATMSFASLLWFTSFHTSGSTMMANKRNMLLETIAVMFLVARSDVSQPRRCTSESNEHTYGCWRQILREFNLEQLIRIVEKVNIRFNAMFESNLVPSRSNSTFKGYQQTFQEFVHSLKAAADSPGCYGPVNVDLKMPAVNQLWEEVEGIMKSTSTWMKPFLALFGAVYGNGLSPFAADIDTPSDLRELIQQFFRPPKKDPRDNKHGTTEESECETTVVEDDMNEDEVGPTTVVGVDIVAAHVNNIQQSLIDGEIAESDIAIDGADGEGDKCAGADSDLCFDNGNSSEAFREFRMMLRYTELSDLSISCVRVMELLQLRTIDKGSVKRDSKAKSLHQRWFSAKGVKGSMSNTSGDLDYHSDVYIERDTLVTMKCKQGKDETIQHYRVLALFYKFYNKWFVSTDIDRFPWKKDSKSVRMLCRMMRKCGTSYEEVMLQKNGEFGPSSIFCTKYMNEILTVECNLVD